jgi:hypothetical protein
VYILQCIDPIAVPAIAAAVPAALYVGSKLAIPRDAKLAKGLVNAKLGYRSYEKNDTINIAYRFEEACKKHPNREALVFEGRSYTFQDIQRGRLQEQTKKTRVKNIDQSDRDHEY